MRICLNRECLAETPSTYMVTHGRAVVEVEEDCLCKRCASNLSALLKRKGKRDVRIREQDPVCHLFPRYMDA